MSQPVRRTRKRTDWGPRSTERGLRRWLPHAYVMPGSPLFAYLGRNLTWGKDPNALVAHTRFSLIVGLLLTVLLGGGGAALTLAAGVQIEGNTINLLTVLVWLITLFTVVFRLMFDMPVVLDAANTLDAAFNTEHTDLIRVTPLRPNDLVRVRFAIAQIPQWRALDFAMGLHLLASGLLIFDMVFVALMQPQFSHWEPIIALPDRSSAASVIWLTADNLMLIVLLMVLTVLFVAEPRLRLNVLAALGLAIAVHRLPFGLRLVFSVVSVIVFWGVQAALLYLPLTLVDTVLAMEVGTGSSIVYLHMALALPLVIYNGYKLLWERLLRYAAHRLDW